MRCHYAGELVPWIHNAVTYKNILLKKGPGEKGINKILEKMIYCFCGLQQQHCVHLSRG